MAGSYRKDFDYSEAIANTTDAAKRQELLAERQNKIEAEGLAGKVAGNDAVSTWTGNYRPYTVSSTATVMNSVGGSWAGGSDGAAGSRSYGYDAGFSVAGLYEAAEAARLKRFEAARKQIANRLESSLSAIDSDYRAGMTQTDINARQSVLRNEEKMAALGLNMSGRSDAPTSGMAETSRIAIDNQYRSDLNALGQARLSARAAAQTAASDQEAAAENGYYSGEDAALLSQAQAALQQFNADRDYSLSIAGLTGFLNGTPTLGYRQYALDADTAAANQAAAQANAQAAQDAAKASAQTAAQTRAYEQAFDRWKTTGYVQPNDAAILGVPAGTPTADASYKNASLALQRWKAGYYY